MIALALLVGSIALADSVNPSTLIPALWLASAPSGGKLTSYTLGVFGMYLAGGLVLVFGPGPALITMLGHVQGPIEHALEAAGGTLALGFALVVWRSRDERADWPGVRRCQTRRSAFALGAGIMAVELPTALIYFGAISAILAARPAATVEISLLTTYNAVFVAPLLALIVVCHLGAARAQRWLAAAEVRLQSVAHYALTGVASVAGAVLFALGLSGLLLS